MRKKTAEVEQMKKKNSTENQLTRWTLYDYEKATGKKRKMMEKQLIDFYKANLSTFEAIRDALISYCAISEKAMVIFNEMRVKGMTSEAFFDLTPHEFAEFADRSEAEKTLANIDDSRRIASITQGRKKGTLKTVEVSDKRYKIASDIFKKLGIKDETTKIKRASIYKSVSEQWDKSLKLKVPKAETLYNYQRKYLQENRKG